MDNNIIIANKRGGGGFARTGAGRGVNAGCLLTAIERPTFTRSFFQVFVRHIWRENIALYWGGGTRQLLPFYPFIERRRLLEICSRFDFFGFSVFEVSSFAHIWEILWENLKVFADGNHHNLFRVLFLRVFDADS